MVLPKSILDEIDLRMTRIQNNPRYFSKRAAKIERNLRELVDAHSFWIEHPELRDRVLVETGVATERELKSIARKGINQIGAAWGYLTSDKMKDSRVGVLGYVSPKTVLTVGRMVEPGLNSEGYRKNYVDGFRHTVPSPSLVPKMLTDICSQIKDADLHPVQKAIGIHVDIARIQPLEEGNKRTARLMEGRVLESYGYPSPFVPYGERYIYLDLLQDAALGSQKQDVKLQRPFYEYIAGKVASVLDEIIGDLKITQ